jgi:hypothetical protein
MKKMHKLMLKIMLIDSFQGGRIAAIRAKLGGEGCFAVVAGHILYSR